MLLQHLGASQSGVPSQGRVQRHFSISFQPARDWRPPGCSISSQAAVLSCLLGSVALSFPRSSSRCPVQEDPQMPSGQIISFLQAGRNWGREPGMTWSKSLHERAGEPWLDLCGAQGHGHSLLHYHSRVLSCPLMRETTGAQMKELA